MKKITTLVVHAALPTILMVCLQIIPALCAENQAGRQFTSSEQKEQAEWLACKAAVEQKWDVFLDSTPYVWVDYGTSKEERSEVDFENGVVKVTALVPREVEDPRQFAADRLLGQIKKMLSRENPANIEALQDQIRNRSGVVVDAGNVAKYFTEELLPNIRMDSKPYQGRDGLARLKAEVRIDLVADHIRIRAEKHLETVRRQAKRFAIEPELMLAVIHTESFFNPMAKSDCNAIGLMQLMPRRGARDAYNFVYKQDRIVDWKYLYEPDKNIELGAAYLCLLRKRHFSGITDDLKNIYLTVCGYNWGPTAVMKNIVGGNNINNMDADRLFAFLLKKAPKETSDYLEKVVGQMKMYAGHNWL